ncbi:MAG: DUF4381 domain-containing protein [Pseudomonadales bacterium]|nr:DUF4381 domain-containing protein [Pseudomonadales bacterium]
MNPTDPLANLKDIHIPDPITGWPPAIGWWLLALIAIAAIVGVVIWLIKNHRKNAYRREALDQLAQLRAKAAEQDSVTTATQLSGLLKQVAITLFGRHHTAGLNGDAWLQFLDEKGKTDAFSQGEGRILGDDIYKPNIPIDVDSLFNLSQQWIKKQ